MVSSRFFTDCVASALGDDFRSRHLSQGVVVADVGAGATEGLLTWGDLNEILATRPVRQPQLRLFHHGKEVPASSYTRVTNSDSGRELIEPDKVYAALRDGASLILDQMETLHPPVAAAACDLTWWLHESAQANLYLTWGTSSGFGAHWDDHDVFVAQVMGQKHWTVYGPSRRFPLDKDDAEPHDRCPDIVVWEGVLRAGQVLHVPRGWWHMVRGVGEVSVHLTFGVTRRTGIDWAEWVVEQLHEHEVFRQDLPRFAPAEVRARHEALLRACLAEALANSSLDDYLTDEDGSAPRAQRFCLPLAVTFAGPDDDTPVEFTPVVRPDISGHPDRVAVSTAGKTFNFAPVLAPMLRALADHRMLPCGALRRLSGLDEDVFRLALEILVEQHLVTIPPEPAGRLVAAG